MYQEYGSAYEITSCVRGEEEDVVCLTMPKHGRTFIVTCKANDSDRVVGVQETTPGGESAIRSRPTREHITEIAQAHLRKNPRLPDDEEQ